jgi:hypothetical protein
MSAASLEGNGLGAAAWASGARNDPASGAQIGDGRSTDNNTGTRNKTTAAAVAGQERAGAGAATSRAGGVRINSVATGPHARVNSSKLSDSGGGTAVPADDTTSSGDGARQVLLRAANSSLVLRGSASRRAPHDGSRSCAHPSGQTVSDHSRGLKGNRGTGSVPRVHSWERKGTRGTGSVFSQARGRNSSKTTESGRQAPARRRGGDWRGRRGERGSRSNTGARPR